MLLLLLLLSIVPIAAFWYARRRYPEHRYLISGIALGSVISPLSLGLYATFFVPYVGLVPGMLGLATSMFHGAPAHSVALHLGVIPPQVVEGASHIYLAVIAGIIWGTVYGCVGWFIDRRLRTKK